MTIATGGSDGDAAPRRGVRTIAVSCALALLAIVAVRELRPRAEPESHASPDLTDDHPQRPPPSTAASSSSPSAVNGGVAAVSASGIAPTTPAVEGGATAGITSNTGLASASPDVSPPPPSHPVEQPRSSPDADDDAGGNSPPVAADKTGADDEGTLAPSAGNTLVDEEAAPSPGGTTTGAAVDFVRPRMAGKLRHVCKKWFNFMRKIYLSVHRYIAVKIGPEPVAVSVLLDFLYARCPADPAGAVVIDIGANDGQDVPYWFRFFGAESPSPCGARTRFFLVEPQAKYQNGLKRVAGEGRATEGKDVLVVHGAVGRDEQHGSSATLHGSDHQGQVDLDGTLKGKRAGGSNSQATPVVSLRRLLQDGGVADTAPVLFLKVDCEGADATIVVDSEPMFAAHRVEVLIMELNSRQRFFARRLPDVADMLARHGYTLYLSGVISWESRTVFVRVDASMLAAWKPQLETLVAVSPAVQQRGLSKWLEPGSAAAWVPDPNHAGCSLGSFAVPCSICNASSARK